MRKSIYFIAPVVAVLLMSGCAKERDNYDKYLTDGTWTLSTRSSSERKVEQKNYVAAATPDQTITEETTSNISGGKETKVDFSQTTLTPGCYNIYENNNHS
jgi:major membrane immunogen (membrane-anchored lipoprotein)